MKSLLSDLRENHIVVNTLLIGTIFVSLTSSMSMPFLAIYLLETTKLDYATIGLIVGAGPLAATLGGFVGGYLSDLLGRSRLMFLSLVILTLSFIGFVFATHTLILLGLSLTRGISASFFNTISKALMGDLTLEEKRLRMFSYRYLAINLGFSIGPMIGTFLGFGGSMQTFLLAGGIYLLYAAVLWRQVNQSKIHEAAATESKVSISYTLGVLRRDTPLLLFLIGGTLLMTVHGQMSVTLSQYLKENIVDGVRLFGVLMSINGLTVLLLQIKLTQWSERFSNFRRIGVGCFLFLCGEIGFAYSVHWTGFILAMMIFTIGEILVVPAEYAQIDQITPQGMRGTFYGAQSFCELGSFLGPWAGGMILSTFGGKTMFLTLGIVSITSLVFYWKGQQIFKKKRTGSTPSWQVGY
ncbi:MFS transporter [Ammoniphilus sp. CFH 90114]|uniref:MDR family MFS transporter n=1 Tax=Ammoniphilus sp. CFH 90114 TaxID=2493665 RepID=UPI00100F5D8E|nr:MFS transporter [Ammoniphilus sp. CFH 90114]RXT07973.1 MFS transporter [Ammoniphilus sp. CFH 90114]